MFFTPELLARRDSGFGLLWYMLAATLGSKSTFKKLPKRSVLTADISQLCELIAQPEEPLALRLSSNLMVGVARCVSKIKQELFMNDVTNCVSSLKKVVQDIHTITAKDASLQMQQQTRPSAFTIAADPQALYFLEFDNFVSVHNNERRQDGDDEQEYNPTGSKKARKKNNVAKPPSLTEQVRADMVTLREHHDHLLSNSFDLSFQGSQRSGLDVSSSQAEPAFAFDDNLFLGIDDGLGIDLGLGEDLARELGEGWALPPPASPANSFAQLLLSQDDGLLPEPALLADVTSGHKNVDQPPKKKTHKRTRLLLDARTELTDDELKIARAQYLSEQYLQRREFISKRLEKDSGRVVEDLIWGVPKGIEAPALIDFWQQNFKVQVETRTGVIHLDMSEEDEPPTKRRKVAAARDRGFEDYMQVDEMEQPELNMENEAEMDRGGNFFETGWNDIDLEPRLRSSEEPGQARQMSKPLSDIGANFSFDLGSLGRQEGSQRSSLFPWDNAGAGPSSSVDAFGGGSDRVSIDRAEIRIRGSSFSRRESSLVPSQNGSTGIRGISPGEIRIRGSQVIGEDFTMNTNTQIDSQKSDLNLITLERNSFNFLEYAKMQQQAMPTGSENISFDVVVPQLTSTRHVAAAAFYHCLVLATKDLLQVHQAQPYGAISLKVFVN
ncbi:Rec8 like protein-domain-containing protein [Lentinula edodes]|nr:Rec8 like protein-domain-containing protein [Lentinula edodes]